MGIPFTSFLLEVHLPAHACLRKTFGSKSSKVGDILYFVPYPLPTEENNFFYC